MWGKCFPPLETCCKVEGKCDPVQPAVQEIDYIHWSQFLSIDKRRVRKRRTRDLEWCIHSQRTDHCHQSSFTIVLPSHACSLSSSNVNCSPWCMKQLGSKKHWIALKQQEHAIYFLESLTFHFREVLNHSWTLRILTPSHVIFKVL